MIDEKKLKKELAELSMKCPYSVLDDRFALYTECFEKAMNLVKDQPKVGEWISVEEGLPKIGQDILATCSNGEVDAGFYGWNDDWNLDYIDIEAHPVIAWMPFPEPYRKEDKLMINDKDIHAGVVFEGLANNKKIVVENVIESKDGVRYVSFYDDKNKKHQVSYELFKRSLLKRCN